MNRWSGVAAVIGALIVVAIAVTALRGVSTEVTVLPPISIPDPADDPAAAIVISRVQSGGFSLLWVHLGTVTRTVTVQFYAEPGCFARVTMGETWPPETDGCGTPVVIAGVVSGGGTTPTGESIINVDIDIPPECFDIVERGDAWPVGEPCPG